MKTVKQVYAIHQQKNRKSKHKGRGCGGHRSHSRSQSRKPGRCSNSGSNHPPIKCKAYGKECFHCHKKGHFSQFYHSKQCGKSPGSKVHPRTTNIHIVMYMRLTNPSLMTLFNLSKTQLQYSSELKPDIPI